MGLKGLPLVAEQRSGPDFMRAHIKVGLAWIAKPYINVAWRVWLLGLSPRSIAFSPFFFFVGSFYPPPLSQLSFPFILVFTSRSSSTCQFFLFGVMTRPINPYIRVVGGGWEKLHSMVWSMGLSGAGLHITVLAAFFLVLFMCWVCPFLQAFYEVSSMRSSSATSLGLQGAFIARPRQ